MSNGVQQLALDPRQAQDLMNQLAAAVHTHGSAALVTAVDIRRHVRKLIETTCFDTPVLSFHELVPALQLDVAARVGLPATPLLEAA